MNNQRDIYAALLAGETLMHNETKVKVMLNTDGLLIREDTKDLTSITFISYVEWQIYTKPRWYENIPEGGVLCWIGDDEDTLNSKIAFRIILDTAKTRGGFKAAEGFWGYAEPLTKQEIQVYLKNAPENL